jgi:hypothetical protein
MPDKQDFQHPAPPTVEDRVVQTVNAGSSWLPALKNVPQQVYLFGLIPLSLLGVFTYLLLTGGATERWIGLVAIIGIIVLCLVFAFLLTRGIDKGAEQRFQEMSAGKVILEAPTKGAEGGKMVKYQYDLFVSAPMASQDDAARKTYNDRIKAIVDKIKAETQFSAYFAGYEHDATSDDDIPELALKHNVRRMRASKLYMFVYTQYEPTSAFIELGMALALCKPSIWFVKKGVRQPYLMRGYQAGGREGLPQIKVYEIDDLEEIAQYVGIHGTELFDISADAPVKEDA